LAQGKIHLTNPEHFVLRYQLLPRHQTCLPSFHDHLDPFLTAQGLVNVEHRRERKSVRRRRRGRCNRNNRSAGRRRRRERGADRNTRRRQEGRAGRNARRRRGCGADRSTRRRRRRGQ
jgi:hypothetical protein